MKTLILSISKNPVLFNFGKQFKNIGYFKEEEDKKIDFNINTDIEHNKLYIQKILFKDFGNICLSHLPQYEKIDGHWINKGIHCECEGKFDLFKKGDVHLRLGKDVEKKALIAIKYLKARGYYYSDKYKNNESITVPFDTFMKYPANRLYAFASIINDLRILGGIYKDHIFGLFKQSNLIPHITYFYIGGKKRVNIITNNSICNNCNMKGHLEPFCWKKKVETVYLNID